MGALARLALPATRGRRVVWQLLLLALLYVASLGDPITFGSAIGFLLLLPPAFTVTVAWVLVWTSRQAPEVESLRERADDAVTAVLQSVGAALVGAVVIATNVAHLIIPGRPALALLAWVCLLIGVPALGWLRTWRDVWLPVVLGRRAGPRPPAPVPAPEVPPAP